MVLVESTKTRFSQKYKLIKPSGILSLPSGLGYRFSRSGSRGWMEKFLSIMYSPWQEIKTLQNTSLEIKPTHVVPQWRLLHSTSSDIGCCYLGGVVVEQRVVLEGGTKSYQQSTFNFQLCVQGVYHFLTQYSELMRSRSSRFCTLNV